MKKVIIFGTEQFGELLYEYITKEKLYEVCAFTVDKNYKTKDTFMGLPVVEFEEIELKYPPIEYDFFVALGYGNMSTVRQKKFQEVKNKHYKILSYTHPTAIVLSENFGVGNIIFEGVTIGSNVKVGEGNVFWANAHVAHHTTVGNFNFFTISVAIAGNILIQDNCFFGNNCTVRNHIKIANYTLIGAGSYIDKSTQEFGVYVPARTLLLENKKSVDINL